MGSIIYRLSIFGYRVALHVAAVFTAKARLFIRGRSSTFEVLKRQMENGHSQIVWFHCASLGEFEQGRPVIEAFKKEFPSYKILLTFFSPSGYEVRKDYPLADFVHYLPLDTKKNAEQWIRLVKPRIVFFVKYEFWHFYIKTLKDHKIPVLSISSIFRQGQIYFRSSATFQQKILKNVTHFFVQDTESSDLLRQIDIDTVTVSGDTRFDRVADICRKARDIEGIHTFVASKKVMVIGSCWPEDMEILYPFITFHDLKYIIAPHEINSGFIGDIQRKSGKSSVRFSEGKEAWSGKDVLIIDNIGMLSSLYKYANYAYVGGAFGKGLHNILEAATFGLPVFFGNKNYQKFREAVELEEKGGAFPIGSFQELQAAFMNLHQEEGPDDVGKISGQYVRENTGATATIMSYAKKLLV